MEIRLEKITTDRDTHTHCQYKTRVFVRKSHNDDVDVEVRADDTPCTQVAEVHVEIHTLGAPSDEEYCKAHAKQTLVEINLFSGEFRK